VSANLKFQEFVDFKTGFCQKLHVHQLAFKNTNHMVLEPGILRKRVKVSSRWEISAASYWSWHNGCSSLYNLHRM